MRNGLLLGVLILFGSVSARAGLLFEPYAKYSMGSFQATTLSNATSKWKANGIGAGARLGFAGRHLFLVADYGAVFSGKLEADSTGATDLDNFKESQLGAVIGLNFGGLRIFGGYDFTNELSADNQGVTSTYFGGHAAKLGLGYDFQPIAINVEYVANTYDKVKSNGSESSVHDAGYSEIKGSAIVLSLSAPLGF